MGFNVFYNLLTHKKKALGEALAIFLILILIAVSSCSRETESNEIMIYTTGEDFRTENLRADLDERFPDYDITIEYYPTGNLAAKLVAESGHSEGDIIHSFDYGYYSMVGHEFAPLDYDTSVYDPDALIFDNDGTLRIVPETKNSGVVVVNTEVLAERNLPEPESYMDLLDPMYKGLISMPNPKTSGTGYMFLKLLVNEMGEDEAFSYFDAFSDNVLQYTTSGSGPANALVQKEVAIGLAMTAHVVEEQQKGAPLKIIALDYGSPFCFYGSAIINGKETRVQVKEVFDYIVTDYIPKERELWFPEKIYKDKDFIIQGYPTDIVYGDMSNNTPEEKERLLSKWEY